MKIKLEVELDTEREQDVELIEHLVQVISELKQQYNYTDDEEK